MRKILLVGAGKSTSTLIEYLNKQAEKEDVHIRIADKSLGHAEKMCSGKPHTTPVELDIFNDENRKKAVKDADIVISMLPARFHTEVARECLAQDKNMVTASYVSDDMQALDEDVKKKGLVFMNEIGVDPGLDHMSAMQVIDRIRDEGGKLLLFESFCGGLVAPESDDNLWNYKFTWNPRNVVLAGQGGAAEFMQENQYKYIPYHKLFRRTEFLGIDGYGKFEGYANRNSLKYRSVYGLEKARTLYRGTLRRVGFSKAWNMFVQLGMTDDKYQLQESKDMSYRQFVNSFLPYSPTDSVELKMRYSLKIDQDDVMWNKLQELDIFNPDKKIGIKNATPAQALQKILADKWTLAPEDKDMIAMYHKFGYELNGEQRQIDSTMIHIGEDQNNTAMAKTVGLPVGIATLKILNGEIKTPGVQRPIAKEVYEPILKELETNHGIEFKETEREYLGYNVDNISG